MPFILQAMSNANQQQQGNYNTAAVPPPVVIPISTIDSAAPTSIQQPQAVYSSGGGGIRVIISSLNAPASNYPPPPSYEEAINPNALPPPAYDSLFGQIQAAHQSSDGMNDFIKNLTILLFGTIGCMACIGLAVVVPFAMVVVGTLYYHDCPVEPKIPLFLVVGGAITLINNFPLDRADPNNEVTAPQRKSSLRAFLTLFSFTWFVLGSFWVYKQYKPSFNPENHDFCHPTVYMLAFWVLTLSYLILLFLALSIFCISFMAIGAAERMQQQVSSRR
ncbi:Hypothetical predicted protein [Cloeon dipterum]|uniref:Uncharacterized protein n=1 Tax=Cloeon dipterum TaxID=197152 RepID=A0A8S1CB19_9INSE|nr:Hypothetical predicted protein [Cloeon dipterum]